MIFQIFQKLGFLKLTKIDDFSKLGKNDDFSKFEKN